MKTSREASTQPEAAAAQPTMFGDRNNGSIPVTEDHPATQATGRPDQRVESLLETIAQEQGRLTNSTASNGTVFNSTGPHPAQCQSSPSIAESDELAALLDLVSRMLDQSGTDSAARRLVNDLAQHFAASSVSLTDVGQPGNKCTVVAESNCERVDARDSQIVAIQAVAQETVCRSCLSMWPADHKVNQFALLTFSQMAESFDCDYVVSLPVHNSERQMIAVLVVAGRAVSEEQLKSAEQTVASGAERAARFLAASEQALATALQIRRRLDQAWYVRLLNSARATCAKARFRISCAAIMIFAAAMMIPADYRVSCQVELQPVSRRFVAAPFAAQLKKCLVETGDVVEANQLLATLDGREIRWELAGVQADLEKARKERDAHLSERNYGLAKIARLEAERLQNKAEVLLERLRKLEIRSPLTGIVVAGDLTDAEGAPLETGQSLFEIAPLEQMQVEVGIPEEDVRHVSSGMNVRIQLDAMPAETFETELRHVRPVAEIFDHENVFVGEADLENTHKRLRPGMRGRAKVSTGPRALGWNLFHKPVTWVVGWLAW